MTTTAYTGRATNWTMVAVSGLLLVPLIGLASSEVDRAFVLVVGLALLGVLAEVATASDVRVACGSQGVSVHWGVLGWPRMRYTLDEIEDVSVVQVPWWAVSFGFWWTPWRTVCTVRSGPALRLLLRTGRRVTLTVPDPHAAAAALRAVR